VKGIEHVVGAEMNVGFEVPIPEVDRVLKRRQRVLRKVARATAMSEREHPIVVEKGVARVHAPSVVVPACSTLTTVERTRRAFAQLVAPGDGRLDGNLDHAALLIAQAIDSTVNLEEQLQRLDVLAAELAPTTPAELALGLFGGADHDPAVHFSGNQHQYYDPDNSLLHRVLDRRLGIPISLAVLLIEIGRRLGIHLHGVGMPGHFLVRSRDGFIDPFNGGVMFDEQGCHALFRRLAGPGAALPDGALDATPPAFIAKRMLFNLAAIGTNQQQRRALHATRCLLATFPDATHREHVQHAYAAAEIGQFREAATAAERALETIPGAVHEKLQTQIDRWRSRLN